MSMLRRLFLSLVTIESFSLEPQPTLWGGERTHQLRGRRCHKIAKTSLTDTQLAYSIGKLYGFAGFRGSTEVFSGKTIPTCSLHA